MRNKFEILFSYVLKIALLGLIWVALPYIFAFVTDIPLNVLLEFQHQINMVLAPVPFIVLCLGIYLLFKARKDEKPYKKVIDDE